MRETLCAIVLAAGRGSRYRQVAGEHRNKLLAQCTGRDGSEQSVLEHVLSVICPLVDKCVVVTRPEYPGVAELSLQQGCEVVILDSPGMGDSIAAAVAAEPHHRGWVVALGDMPFILPETVERVIGSLDATVISVPVYEGKFGHPVGFGRDFGPSLMTLAGEKGARRLFAGAAVKQVAVSDPGVLWDIDVPAALRFIPG